MAVPLLPACYSVRLARPFLPLLTGPGQLPPAMLTWLEGTDDDTRLPMAAVHDFLARVVHATGDEALGLKAAARSSLGDAGVLAYAMSSAPTFGAALDVARRYMRLLNDDLALTLRECGDWVEVHLDNQQLVPRAVVDFQLCAMLHGLRAALPHGLAREMWVTFEYARPHRLAAHRRVLGRTRLRFAEAHTGFGFPARFLSAPMRRSDAPLHGILLDSAERRLAELPVAASVTARVRAIVLAELAHGAPSGAQVARRLDLSLRTFVRRLHDEGTTYAALLDDLRRKLAHHYLVERGLPPVETALLTGFAQAPAFHRAFRRWTGTTPGTYQRTLASPATSPRALPERVTA